MRFKLKNYSITITAADITVLLTLFLSGSLLTSNDIIPPWISKTLWCLILVLAAAQTRKSGFRVPRESLLLIFNILLTTIFFADDFSSSFFLCIAVAIAALMVNIWSYTEFMTAYTRAMRFLCGFSLVMFFLCFLFPGLQKMFLVQSPVSGIYYCNYIFFAKIAHETGLGRNSGMFWEPGAFQTFICIAMLYEASGKELNLKHIGLYALTILTTFSTTGYAVLALTCVYMYLMPYCNRAKVRKGLGIGIVCGLTFMLLNWDLFFSTSGYTTFGKLILYRTSEAYHNQVSSVSIRLNAVIQPIRIFLRHPFLGVGMRNFRSAMQETTWGVTTATFLNWFALYGVVCGSVMVNGLIKIARQSGANFMARFLYCTAFVLCTISENFAFNAMIVIILLYGYSIPKSRQAKIELSAVYNCPEKPNR